MNTPLTADEIGANLRDVRARIHKAALAAKRTPDSIRLIAVSKTHTADSVSHAIANDQFCFGENRVQEAAGKFPELKARHPDIELHLIGPLQSNKTRDAVELFDAIHTLDRESLAEALAREHVRAGRMPQLFVQVNTGEEPQKAGVAPRDAIAFIDECREKWKLTIAGLMCIPPVEDPPAPHFALLLKLARQAGLDQLSMGMSDDFETAIALGATHIRVGSAIFGARPKA